MKNIFHKSPLIPSVVSGLPLAQVPSALILTFLTVFIGLQLQPANAEDLKTVALNGYEATTLDQMIREIIIVSRGNNEGDE